jgi:CheY-like chemotaxis protein
LDGLNSSRAPRVLLVEDDPVVAYALEHDLKALGAEIVLASDGQAALQVLTDEILSLDLIVTDLEMPTLDGLGLVQLLRTSCGETDLTILAIADHVSNEVRTRFQAQGVGVLAKDAGLKCIVEEARRLLEYAGRLATPSAPPLKDDPWAPRPLPRASGPIGRMRS